METGTVLDDVYLEPNKVSDVISHSLHWTNY